MKKSYGILLGRYYSGAYNGSSRTELLLSGLNENDLMILKKYGEIANKIWQDIKNLTPISVNIFSSREKKKLYDLQMQIFQRSIKEKDITLSKVVGNELSIEGLYKGTNASFNGKPYSTLTVGDIGYIWREKIAIIEVFDF